MQILIFLQGLKLKWGGGNKNCRVHLLILIANQDIVDKKNLLNQLSFTVEVKLLYMLIFIQLKLYRLKVYF